MRRLMLIIMALVLLPMTARAAEIPEDIKAYNEEAEATTNVSRYLLAGLEYCESGFDDHAVNKAGTCFGLCQVYKRFHIARMERLGVTDLYDRRSNIMVAADLLGELFQQYEDVGMVLMVYGGASGKAKKRYLQDGTLPKWARRILDQATEYERKEGESYDNTAGDTAAE